MRSQEASFYEDVEDTMLRKIVLLVLFPFFCYAQNVRKVSATMTMRTAHKGKTTNTRAELCYATSGRMVTKFPKPAELYVINNLNGEMRVYDPSKTRFCNNKTLQIVPKLPSFSIFYTIVKQTWGFRAWDLV